MYRNENMGDSTQCKNQTKRLSRSHHNEEITRHYVKDEEGGQGQQRLESVHIDMFIYLRFVLILCIGSGGGKVLEII